VKFAGKVFFFTIFFRKKKKTVQPLKALFASFEERGRKGLGGEGKGRKGREKGGKAFPLFGS